MCTGSVYGLKKSLHATKRDTEVNRQRRAEFLETIRAIPPERLIYLDESGVTTQITMHARLAGLTFTTLCLKATGR